MNNKHLKVEHVLAARQSRNHKCHWPKCPVHVPPAMWGCGPHWRRLPKKLRDRIWETYEVDQEENMTPSDEYIKAARKVQRWIQQNYGDR